MIVQPGDCTALQGGILCSFCDGMQLKTAEIALKAGVQKIQAVQPNQDDSQKPGISANPTAGSGNSANAGDNAGVLIWIMMLWLAGISGGAIVLSEKKRRSYAKFTRN